MLVALKGSEFSNHIAEEIALLTGKAFLLPKSFVHDRDGSKVLFEVERAPLLRVRYRLFGTMESPEYETATSLIRTRVIIGAVETVELTNRYEAVPERLQIIRGILLCPKGVTITSVEENRGDPFYEIRIATKGIDVIVEDVSEAPSVLQ